MVVRVQGLGWILFSAPLRLEDNIDHSPCELEI